MDAKQLWDEGWKAGQARNYARARDCFLALAGEGRPEVLLMLARALQGLGDHRQALGWLNLLTKVSPEPGRIWFFQGRSWSALQNWPRAEAALRRAQRAGFTHPALYGLWGQALLRLRHLDAAAAALQKAWQLAPRDQRVRGLYLQALALLGLRRFQEHRWAEARELLDTVWAQGLRGPTLALYRAWILREQGRWAEALSLLDQVPASQGSDPALSWQRWECLVRLGRSSEAADLARRLGPLPATEDASPAAPASRQAPQTSLAWDQLPWWFFHRRQYRRSVHLALSHLKAHQGDPADLHFLIAQAQYQLKDFAKARNHLLQALKRRPDSAVLLEALVVLLAEHIQGEQAWPYLQRWRRTDPSNPWMHTYFLLGSAEGWSGEPPTQDLLSRIEQALELKPEAPYFWRAKALVLHHLGQTDPAQKALAQSLHLKPLDEDSLEKAVEWAGATRSWVAGALERYANSGGGNIQFLRLHAQNLLDRKAWKEALPWVQQLSAQGSRRTKEVLAFLYRRLGRWHEALGVYRLLAAQPPVPPSEVFGAALCLQALGLESQADQILRLQKIPAVDLLISRAQKEEARKNWVAASQVYRKILDSHPQKAEAWRGLARCARAQGEEAKAERYEKRAQATIL